MTSADLRRPRGSSEARPFSLRVYLLIVVILSWPFQIAYVLWGFDKAETPLMSYGLSSLSMVMVAVGTFVAGRYVFRDGFAEAGWGWGRPRDYAAVFGLVALVWVVPTVLELALGARSLGAGVIASEVLAIFVLRFVATLIPAFGEEFGWRGYMLPRLARRYAVRRALLLHAFVWWAWHLPTLVGFGTRTEGVGGGRPWRRSRAAHQRGAVRDARRDLRLHLVQQPVPRGRDRLPLGLRRDPRRPRNLGGLRPVRGRRLAERGTHAAGHLVAVEGFSEASRWPSDGSGEVVSVGTAVMLHSRTNPHSRTRCRTKRASE